MTSRLVRASALAAGAVLVATPAARAADVVVVASGFTGSPAHLEAQGFAGRIGVDSLLPAPLPSPDFAVQWNGITTNGTTLYALATSFASGPITYSVLQFPMNASGPVVVTPLGAQPLDDIAILDGHLYGVRAAPQSPPGFQVVSIAGDGTLSPISTQTGSASSWRLSANSVTGRLIVAGVTSSPRMSVVDPITGAITHTALTSGTVNDTIVRRDGAAVATFGSQQKVFTLPDLAPAGTLDAAHTYGSGLLVGPGNVVSDEFSLAFPSDRHAVIAVGSRVTAGSLPGLGKLLRRPQVLEWTSAVELRNGIAPDDTIISNVVATSVTWSGLPASGVTQTTTVTPAGDFSRRDLAQTRFRIDLSQVPLGIYSVTPQAIVAGDYTHGTSTERRDLQQSVRLSQGFAYDPTTDNAAGDGGFDLLGIGWERTRSSVGPDSATFPFGGTGYLGQTLGLPTGSGPLSFHFDYRMNDLLGTGSDTAQITARLNGVVIATITLNHPTAAYQTYSATLTDASLWNQMDARLEFQVDHPVGDREIEIDNVFLSATPEPSTAAAAILLVASLSPRRHRQLPAR